jgi:hypothetical protein
MAGAVWQIVPQCATHSAALPQEAASFLSHLLGVHPASSQQCALSAQCARQGQGLGASCNASSSVEAVSGFVRPMGCAAVGHAVVSAATTPSLRLWLVLPVVLGSSGQHDA